MSVRTFSSWITCPRPRVDARLRLFCLPFAGGGASAYRLWPAALPAWVEVCPVQLPGREDRYRETAFTSVVGLSRALAREVTPFLDVPYVVFGHSMGALVAFELTRALRQGGSPQPEALFLAAYQAPHLAPSRPPIHHLPAPAFLEEMRRMRGTPEAVLQNADLMNFMLPVLRADFEACDSYAFVDEPPLDCPLFVYGGTEDHEVNRASLEAWRTATRGLCRLRLMAGSHFFVQSHRDDLLSDITSHLNALPI